MIDRHGFAISVPPEELGDWNPPASVYSVEALAAAPLAASVRGAVALITEAARRLSVPVLCIARPEMFTHGGLLDWLKQRLGPMTNHLYFSNGLTVRVIPGMRNHVLFYDVGTAAAAAAFADLQRRLPELLMTLASQVWTTFALPGTTVRVPTAVMFASEADDAAAPSCRGLCLRTGTQRLGAEMILDTPPIAWAEAVDGRTLIYVPLTEMACADRHFMKIVARHALRAFFDPHLRVVLRLPDPAGDQADPETAIVATLAALAASGIALPRTRTTRVLLIAQDLPSTHLPPSAALELVLHHSFPAWRHAERFYQAARRITLSEPPPPSPDGTPLHVASDHLVGLRRRDARRAVAHAG